MGTITAGTIHVVGGYNNNGGQGSASPIPTTGASQVPDPFGAVPTPTVPVVGVWHSYVRQVIENGGIVWNNGTVTGSGVTFFLTANPTSQYGGVSISGNDNVALSAPTSGPYHGILFYQDRSIPSTGVTSTFEGGSGMALTGSLYFPTTAITYTGGSSTAPTTTGLVADTITFKGNSYFATDPNGAKTGLGLPTIGMLE